VQVDGCCNFRDAGGWPLADGGTMRTGALYRADDPIRLTDAGRATVASLGLAAVIDVRQHAQFVRRPGFLGADRTLHRPLVDRVLDVDDPPRLDRADDIADLYDDMLARSTPQVAEVLDLIATHLADGPVLVHCAFGKDRTGLIVALVQAIIGVPADAIVADYARSDEPTKVRYRWMLAEPLHDDPPIARSPVDLFRAPADAMEAVVARMEARHGSLAGWAATFPTAPDTPARLRAALIA
jgi:protein-tyrosine phosphatase